MFLDLVSPGNHCEQWITKILGLLTELFWELCSVISVGNLFWELCSVISVDRLPNPDCFGIDSVLFVCNGNVPLAPRGLR